MTEIFISGFIDTTDSGQVNISVRSIRCLSKQPCRIFYSIFCYLPEFIHSFLRLSYAEKQFKML